MKEQEIFVSEWNDALDAAARLFAKGYKVVRRPLDEKTMTYRIDVYPGDPKVKGDYIEACHCGPNDDGPSYLRLA